MTKLNNFTSDGIQHRIRLVREPGNTSSGVTAYLEKEDDENWFIIDSFDAFWLEDLKAAVVDAAQVYDKHFIKDWPPKSNKKGKK